MPPKGKSLELFIAEQQSQQQHHQDSQGFYLQHPQPLLVGGEQQNGTTTTTTTHTTINHHQQHENGDIFARGEEEEEEEERSDSSTSAEDLENCERCGREGEVLECDLEGCEKLWHVACVDQLNGKVPEGRWICPGPHEEVCEICKQPGEVIVCDVKNCLRVFHLKCVPSLNGTVPKGFWECPSCIQEKQNDLICYICQEKKQDDPLVKCYYCTEAAHLRCLRSDFFNALGLDCISCSLKHGGNVTLTNLRDVKIEFKQIVDDIDKARVIQIIKGADEPLTEKQAHLFLDSCIALDEEKVKKQLEDSKIQKEQLERVKKSSSTATSTTTTKKRSKEEQSRLSSSSSSSSSHKKKKKTSPSSSKTKKSNGKRLRH